MFNFIMKVIRKVLGNLILLQEFLFPAQCVRPLLPADQMRLDAITKNWKLYQFPGCPFCYKVRQAMRRCGINVETVDALPGTPFAHELIQNGGELQVPCLKMTDPQTSKVTWMYESDDIIEFFKNTIQGLSQSAQIKSN